MYRSAKRWSKADGQYLTEHYATDSWEDLQSHFYWLEKASIIAHASQLKIKRGVYFWSDDDLSVLRREYANGTSVRKISELLCGKFTESAIATKVYKLGITRRHFWTDDELDLLREHYEVSTNDELAMLFPGIPLRHIQEKGRDLGLHAKTYWDRKWMPKDDIYLREHYLVEDDETLAQVLNRSRYAVKTRRGKLGLLHPAPQGVYEYLREYLFPVNRAWRKKSIEACHYRCVITGGDFTDVHHLYGANLIVGEALDNLNLEWAKVSEFNDEQLEAIAREYQRLHDKYPLGVCLSKEVHMQFHNEYGYGNNTPEQFKQFLQERYPTVQIPVTITDGW